MGRLRLEWKYS